MNQIKKFTILPVYIADTPTGILLKRGDFQTHLQGKNIGETFAVLRRALTNQYLTRQEILRQFAGSQHTTVTRLIEVLHKRRIIIEQDSAKFELQQSTSQPNEAEQIFNWHFDIDADPDANSNRQGAIAIVGNNPLSMIVINSLKRSNINDLLLINDPALTNMANQNTSSHDLELSQLEQLSQLPQQRNIILIVACSDFGGQHLLKPWNQRAIDLDIPFMPVLQENMLGKLGPLVIPKRSPCLECLSLRQNTHLNQFKRSRAFEQLATSPIANGYHQSMLEVLGETAAFEIGRYIHALPEAIIGRFVQINLYQHQTSVHKVLKAPRCSVCSSLNEITRLAIDQPPWLHTTESSP